MRYWLEKWKKQSFWRFLCRLLILGILLYVCVKIFNAWLAWHFEHPIHPR
jgi:hypothetical protein